MEIIDILHIVLAGSLIALVVILGIIGFYIITVLSLVKKVLTRAEYIAFNLSHIKEFTKLGMMKSLVKLFDYLRKGGGDYGKSRSYSS